MRHNHQPLEIELDLSVCTVVGRDLKSLRRLLDTVYTTADPVGFEVIVAEAGESGAAALADDFPGLLVARLAGRSPLAAANHAMALGRGRYIALVEADVQVQPACLPRLITFMDDHPDVGLVFPRIIDAYGKTEPSCFDFPKLLGACGLPMPVHSGQMEVGTTEVDWCRGGLHLLRRELLEEIGLFDVDCGTLAELDLYWRARRQGWHSHYLFEAVAVHANPGRYHLELSTVTSAWSARLRDGLWFLKKRWFG